MSACFAAKDNQEVYRPLANFTPTVWKDSSIFTSSLPITEIESNDRRAEELKQKVEEMLITPLNDPVVKVSFIESICRLGVSYHFENEVEGQLNQIFEAQPNVAKHDDYDLYIVALLFRVFRQHGYKNSSQVLG
ncbi:casbene synthase, chloroplastic-like [Pistacia vera]|uniref:casbene synthase, chloroplastic-like n=1 Tax=Pistacia vera TaxID=55513 RepID=UPI001262B3F3|nr:casbene synthase, chloroplastic-like [Pistacia vera]